MPKISMRENFEMQTRNTYTKVNCELGVVVEGKELPNMSVIGTALEEANALFQAKIKESYEVVPPRVDTPVATPYAPVT